MSPTRQELEQKSCYGCVFLGFRRPTSGRRTVSAQPSTPAYDEPGEFRCRKLATRIVPARRLPTPLRPDCKREKR